MNLDQLEEAFDSLSRRIRILELTIANQNLEDRIAEMEAKWQRMFDLLNEQADYLFK